MTDAPRPGDEHARSDGDADTPPPPGDETAGTSGPASPPPPGEATVGAGEGAAEASEPDVPPPPPPEPAEAAPAGHLQPSQAGEAEGPEEGVPAEDTPDPYGRELASPLIRLGARVADAFILYSLINLALFGVTALLGLETDVEVTGGQQAILLAAMFAVPMLYETVGTAKWGRTGGKYLLGAAAVDRDTGEWPAWSKAINRSVLLYAPFFVFPPFSFMLWPAVVVTMFVVDGQRRGPQDRIARTIVVRTARPDRMGARRPATGGASTATGGAAKAASPEAPAGRRGRGRRGRGAPASPPQKKLPPGVEARKRRWQERGPGR